MHEKCSDTKDKDYPFNKKGILDEIIFENVVGESKKAFIKDVKKDNKRYSPCQYNNNTKTCYLDLYAY